MLGAGSTEGVNLWAGSWAHRGTFGLGAGSWEHRGTFGLGAGSWELGAQRV